MAIADLTLDFVLTIPVGIYFKYDFWTELFFYSLVNWISAYISTIFIPFPYLTNYSVCAYTMADQVENTASCVKLSTMTPLFTLAEIEKLMADSGKYSYFHFREVWSAISGKYFVDFDIALIYLEKFKPFS